MKAENNHWWNIKQEDHWSCIAHLIAEGVLKSAVIKQKKFKNIECKWFGPRSMTDLDLGTHKALIQLSASTNFVPQGSGELKHSAFRGDVWNNGHIYMYIVQGQGQTNPWEQFFVTNINFYQIGHLLQVFPNKWLYKTFPQSNTYTTQFDLAVK